MKRLLQKIKQKTLFTWNDETAKISVRIANYTLAAAILFDFWVAGQATRQPDQNAYASIMQVAKLPVWLTMGSNNNDDCDTGLYNCNDECCGAGTNDIDCDCINNDQDNDDDGDGFDDSYDPNPTTCDPCLKPNNWELDMDSIFNPDSVTVSIGDTHTFWFWWDYNGSHNSCNFPESCGSTSWSVSGGTEGVHYTITEYYDNADITFLKGGEYTVTATHNGWSGCEPIYGNCDSSYTGASGGNDSIEVQVKYDINPYKYIRNSASIWSDTIISNMASKCRDILSQGPFDYTEADISTNTSLTSGTVTIGGQQQNAAGDIIQNKGRPVSADANYILVSEAEIWVNSEYNSSFFGVYINEGYYEDGKHRVVLQKNPIPDSDSKRGTVEAHETGHLLSLDHTTTDGNLMTTSGGLFDWFTDWGTNLTNSQTNQMETKAQQINWN